MTSEVQDITGKRDENRDVPETRLRLAANADVFPAVTSLGRVERGDGWKYFWVRTQGYVSSKKKGFGLRMISRIMQISWGSICLILQIIVMEMGDPR